MKEDQAKSKKISRTTKAFRLAYYNIAANTLKEKKQVIPCYAGYASCQITPLGDVWPCCIRGYDANMGNLRDVEYDFKKIWHSQKAQEIRKTIKDKECYCPLANSHYTSILCNFSTLLKVIPNLKA